MNIGKVVEQDIPRLKEIAGKSVHEVVDAPEYKKPEIVADIHSNIVSWCGKKDCVFLKCSDQGEAVAFILIKEYWNLSDIFVIPDRLGRGIGKSLFQEAETICKKLSEKNYIRVNSSVNAAGFYRELGFIDIDLDQEAPDYVVPLIYRF